MFFIIGYYSWGDSFLFEIASTTGITIEHFKLEKETSMKKIIFLSLALLAQMPLFALPTGGEIAKCKIWCKYLTGAQYTTCNSNCEIWGQPKLIL